MDVRGWGDLAYQYIIGLAGGVYTARSTDFRGDTGTNYDPDRHFLVVLEGNFQTIDPTAEQLDRLPVLLAWAAQRFGIATSTIAGHRDYASTACPGSNLYPIIRNGDLRAQVEAIIANGGVTLV
jgi:N-acetyl-anhydromuramyl-L-alanine amidase AmpD